MKKVLAILISVLMIACVLPVGSFADTTYRYNISGDMAADLTSGVEYVIEAGVIMTVPTDTTVYVPSNSKLTVEQGATLVVNGQIDIQKGAEVYVSGTVLHSENIDAGEGSALAELRFPEHDGYCALDDEDDCAITISLGTEDMLGKVTYSEVSPGEVRAAALNSKIYVKVEIAEPVEKYDQYDEQYIDVAFSGVNVKGDATDATLHETTLTTAADVTLTKFDGGRYFYSDCLITLPEKEGYTTSSTDGHLSSEDPYTVKFGDKVSFKVDVDEDYNMNPYEVYVYNGVGFTNGIYEVDGDQATDENGLFLYINGVDPMETDEYGYYTFTARGDSTISVLGVIANEKIEKVTDILSIIKNIFEMIKSFFQQFLGIFGGD